MKSFTFSSMQVCMELASFGFLGCWSTLTARFQVSILHLQYLPKSTGIVVSWMYNMLIHNHSYFLGASQDTLSTWTMPSAYLTVWWYFVSFCGINYLTNTLLFSIPPHSYCISLLTSLNCQASTYLVRPFDEFQIYYLPVYTLSLNN